MLWDTDFCRILTFPAGLQVWHWDFTTERSSQSCTYRFLVTIHMFCLTKLGYIFWKRSINSVCVNKSNIDSEEGERYIEAQTLWHAFSLNIVLHLYCIFPNIRWYCNARPTILGILKGTRCNYITIWHLRECARLRSRKSIQTNLTSWRPRPCKKCMTLHGHQELVTAPCRKNFWQCI
jgi:hypothetical protein